MVPVRFPHPARFRSPVSTLLCVAILVAATPHRAEAQFGKRLLQIGACAGGAFGGVKLGEKLAEMDAKRLKLSPAEAKKREKSYQIGLAMALCGGGAFVAGTTYSKLSDKGRKAREQELLAAVADATPTSTRTYVDPDRPGVTGRATAQPAYAEGNQECRTVEDMLSDGTATDTALVKYCRVPPGEWKAQTI